MQLGMVLLVLITLTRSPIGCKHFLECHIQTIYKLIVSFREELRLLPFSDFCQANNSESPNIPSNDGNISQIKGP